MNGKQLYNQAMGAMMRLAGMLTCEQAAAHLSEFLDGELDPRTARLLEKHLATCKGACPDLADFERALRSALRARGAAPAPPRLEARVQEILKTYRG